MGDEWAGVAEAYRTVASPLSEHMASKALERHSSLWKATGAAAEGFEEGIQFLDIASGPGWFSKLLAAKLREKGAKFSILRTDSSPSMLDMAKQNITDLGVKFAVMDGQDLSTVKDASLDGVNCLFGIMFMPQYPNCFAKMKRVLKPGARATVGTWHTAGGLDMADAFGVYLGCLSPGEVSEGRKIIAVGQDPANLDKLLLEAGFSDVTVRQVEYTLETDNLEAMYGVILKNPASRTSLVSAKHGIAEPSFEVFKEFMTGSPSAAPFRQTEISFATRFVANLGVGTA